MSIKIGNPKIPGIPNPHSDSESEFPTTEDSNCLKLMGNLNVSQKFISLTYIDIDRIDNEGISSDDRVLWIHGWRCNENIFSLQSYSLREYITLNATYIRAPFSAIGPPDPLIAQFFPNQSYYEWFYKVSETNDAIYNSIIDETKSLKDSILCISEFLKTRSYKVLIGFSQGCFVITKLLHYYQHHNLKTPFNKVVLICGVAPILKQGDLSMINKINIPSLHIQGTNDPFYHRSKELEDLYTVPIVVTSSEAHNIPSKLKHLDIYEQVKEFCHS